MENHNGAGTLCISVNESHINCVIPKELDGTASTSDKAKLGKNTDDQPFVIDIPLVNPLDSQTPSQAIVIDMPVSPHIGEEQLEFNFKNEADATCIGKPIHLSNPDAFSRLVIKLHSQPSVLNSERVKDNCYDSFKTWSRRFERQLSALHGSEQEIVEVNGSYAEEPESVPSVERYFDDLEGPELESLRASEKLVLPEDEKWPFLLRFPISSFSMCLGLAIQAVLWKRIATYPSMGFLHVNLAVNLILWCMALALMILVAFIYSLKILFYFEAVRREFYHPVRVNFFFTPWIGCIFLLLGLPPSIAKSLHSALWYVPMAPIFGLELKLYGQWMLGDQRRLSKVANPSSHLAIVGNFVGALLGSYMGLKEGPLFFFAVGLAHYIVLFVTLYQRLPTNETHPKELHPVFFLFIAGPSIASLSWTSITGKFDAGSRMFYFLSLFLYASLVVRVNFFRGFRFSLAWWAYTVPMTSASTATISYAGEVENLFTKILSVALSSISSLTVSALLLTTILHAFVFHNLFPNDIAIAIAITDKVRKHGKNSSFRRTSPATDRSQSYKEDSAR